MKKFDVIVPFLFQPREYQLPFFRAMDEGKQRAILLWHRRSGKDKTLINFTVKRMLERVGTYFYLFPTFTQSDKVIWSGKDKEGFDFLDHFPEELIENKNETKLRITLKNGSIFQLIGTDNFDAIRGTNPIGCVFSEYSWQDPAAWDVVRPILNENGGWAVFAFTPNGRNHGFTLYEMAKNNENWFCQKLTIEDTKAFGLDKIEEERKMGMDESFIQQEYWVSFDFGMRGAYYADQISQARRENRITTVPVDNTVPVDTFWDLGIDDSMAIWFMQAVGRERRFVDYLEADGEDIGFYVQELQKKGYVYGRHYWPHDGEVRELATGKSRKSVAESLGLKPIIIVPQSPVIEGINAMRMVFNQCWFDETRCKRGLQALENYSKEWDDKNKVFRSHPKHDWSSHGSDAMRTFAMGFRQMNQPRREREKIKKQPEFLRMA